jgi:hypothetical protein
MAPAKALADLALQKQLLIAEAQACRLTLAADLHRVGTPLRWLDQLQSRSRTMLWLGAPVAGLFLARRLPPIARWLTRGVGMLRMLQRVGGLLKPSRNR